MINQSPFIVFSINIWYLFQIYDLILVAHLSYYSFLFSIITVFLNYFILLLNNWDEFLYKQICLPLTM